MLWNFEPRVFVTRVGSYISLRHRSKTTKNFILKHYEKKNHVSRWANPLGYTATNQLEKIALINQTLNEGDIC